jgi:hypothetical protein
MAPGMGLKLEGAPQHRQRQPQQSETETLSLEREPTLQQAGLNQTQDNQGSALTLHPLSRTNEHLNNLGNAQCGFALDLTSGFWQIPIHQPPENRY